MFGSSAQCVLQHRTNQHMSLDYFLGIWRRPCVGALYCVTYLVSEPTKPRHGPTRPNHRKTRGKGRGRSSARGVEQRDLHRNTWDAPYRLLRASAARCLRRTTSAASKQRTFLRTAPKRSKKEVVHRICAATWRESTEV